MSTVHLSLSRKADVNDIELALPPPASIAVPVPSLWGIPLKYLS